MEPWLLPDCDADEVYCAKHNRLTEQCAYRAGQLAMRERAAQTAKQRWYLGSTETSECIRALEPEEPK